VVCEFTIATRNRTGRARRGYGEIPRNAHVYNVSFAKNRYESRWTSIGFRFVARKGEN